MVDIETTYRIVGENHSNLAEYLLYRRHLFAYEEVCRHLSDEAIVADVGCGYGYALEMLLQKASKVYAIDAADTALDNLPNIKGVEKLKAFADSIPLEDESVDCVIAFQLLEHLPVESIGNTLNEFVRILRPGGCIYATTPNAKWRLYPQQHPWNPYHVTEYHAEDLQRICSDSLSTKWKMQSVIGIKSAQSIEIARVIPDPVRHFGPSLSSYARKIWQHYGVPRVASWRKLGRREVRASDQERQWFKLSDNPSAGLDLWLEISR